MALYTDSLPGGAHAALVGLAGALDPAFEVSVVGTSAEQVSAIAAARPSATTQVLARPRSKFNVSTIVKHIRAVRALRADVVHVNCDNPWTSPYGLLAGVLSRTPTVAVVHGAGPPAGGRQRLLFRWSARHVSTYVAVSDATARFTESALRRPPGTVRTISNGVAPAGGPPVAPQDPRPVVGGVGRFSDEKGFDTLIEAMDLLPSARLLLVGDGEDRAALEDLVRRRGLEGRVTFTGWLAGRWTLQVGLDVLAVPSRSEGFGLVVIEAMQAGIPVVATEVGGLTEIIRDGENGLLVPPGDPAALAAALGQVLGDAGLRSVLVARAAETAGRYSLEAMATAFARLYREVSR